MAALDYTELVVVCQQLLADTGRPVTFQQLSSTPADAIKPWEGPAAPTVASSVAAFATFVPVSSAKELGILTMNQELLRQTTLMGLVAPTSGFDFRLTNRVVDGGVHYGVLWVDMLCPGATPLLYAFGLAK